MSNQLTMEQLVRLIEHNTTKIETLKKFIDQDMCVDQCEISIRTSEGEYGYINLNLSSLDNMKFLRKAAIKQATILKNKNEEYKTALTDMINSL